MTSRSFVLAHTFKDVSKLEEVGSYYSDIEVRHDIPWNIRIFKKEGFLGVNLHCEKEECFEAKKWSCQTKFTMKLVAIGGKFFRRTVQHEFQKPEGHGMDKFISWEKVLEDYVDNDSIIIEIHANIVRSTGFFEVKYLPVSEHDSDNSFVLKHTFKNISRFVELEKDFSDLEEHFNIPWRMQIQKSNEFLGIYLHCEKEICEGRNWAIECEFEFRLISASGKLHSTEHKSIFGATPAWGRDTFISWNGMEKDYINNDSIDVEICVKIINNTDAPHNIANAERTFFLSHSVKNMSRIEEGEEYYTGIQTRFNIPWKLKIKKQSGFFGLFLHCFKQLDEFRKWSIETEYQLKVVSSNGRSVSFSFSYLFDKPFGYGWLKLLRWDNLEEKYIVNDTLVIEAHVKILNMTGIEDETAIVKSSGIVIPVGNQEYSLEKWLEMAFDH
ncbi:MATH domain-containing protein [Caenorhabditis elegans]|uniref:MATH domain-containing protein n=1 Tax=Caenorhabditis elegans TaxID=6239 RepID=O17191_CAEEL|nr:MATH domain-containing protein [Caenorhabditis elegans]CCD64683.1 MATH domain-containing protein [Caenorhabditis elegans]|eukprot:NP_494117.1 MATH (meprin-associated Traf homology) domain containing [Caenorhabditis elegans]